MESVKPEKAESVKTKQQQGTQNQLRSVSSSLQAKQIK